MPSGTRSPSQRCRVSITERTPPRLVAFVISCVDVSTRPRRVAVRDVERHQPPETGVADDLDARVPVEPARELARRLALPLDAQPQRAQAPEQEPAGVGRRDDSRRRSKVAQPRRVLLAPADDRSEQDVVVAGEVLRGAVEDEVGAVLERAQVDGRRGGRVDDDRRRVRRRGLEVGHRQERIRRRLGPDELHAVGGGPVWSYSTTFSPQ